MRPSRLRVGPDLRRAVERELSIVGEAVSQGTRRFPDLEESIGPARQIVGFRNRIIHGSADVDSSIVWAIVQNEVPRLLEKSEAIMALEARREKTRQIKQGMMQELLTGSTRLV